mmetsp:Transcript_38273/g.92597  ORF Transcript_38273/g.92597 Transcript_38273/m.92597 type:complete len:227 (+) Transcript_38273:96-776(+)
MTSDDTKAVATNPTMAEQHKKKSQAKLERSKNVLTESKPFQKVVESTFKSMDRTGNGHVSKDELYAGLLTVHLKLAKYAGAAACYPPDKSVCDDLFDAADHDNSGGIDKDEFVAIMGVCCAQILTRMMFYYLILLLFVPYLSANIVDLLMIPNGSYMEMILENIFGFAMFYIAVPVVWDFVDDLSRSKLEKKIDEKEKPLELADELGAEVVDAPSPNKDNAEKKVD